LEVNFMINLTKIKKLKPCEDSLNNYIKFYGDRNFTPKQFMGLKNITHEEKLWVAFRLVPNNFIGKATGEMARSVLYLYEKEYPNDRRPRAAVDAIAMGNVTVDTVFSAHEAANTASYAAADAANSAASAAHSAYAANANFDAAFHAYACAAAANSANAAYYSAANAIAAYHAVINAVTVYYAAANVVVKPPTTACAAAVFETCDAAKRIQEKLCRTIILKYWKE
jgi:hypothetical protein